MWYASKEGGISLDGPIVAEQDSTKLLLLPQMGKETGYEIIGYNWFNLTTGKYNSCSFFKTAKEAIDSYSGYGG